MQLHQIKHKLKTKKRIGRGGKRGSYSGHGIKGQRARAGRKIRPALRDIILKLPKRRGFKFQPQGPKAIIINLKTIEQNFQAGEVVTISVLKAKKLIAAPKSNKKLRVKVLGTGQLTKRLTFAPELLFSSKTKEKIAGSGSKISS